MPRRAARSGGVRLGIAVGLGVLLWHLPLPEGLTPQAWHLLAIFVATIVGIVLQPLRMGAVAVFGIAAVTLTGTIGIQDALSGFGNTVIWLVVMAFFISRGFIKTGLGSRIAYTFISLLGRRTLGLSYSMIATDLVLAPVIPSITARAGAVIYPIVRSVAEAYDSRAGDGTERRVGALCLPTTRLVSVLTTRNALSL